MNRRAASLVLRLAGPMQSWGTHSQFNRRETAGEPTKSGVLGLLAAAQGRRRSDPIEDLLGIRIGVRTDQAGTLLRDYHTVSDFRGRPLPSAQVTAKGTQKPTAPAKYTHVTQRYYLQDAVFVVAVHADPALLVTLREALRRPAFPLALGRRSCVPTQPLLLPPHGEAAFADEPGLWAGDPEQVLRLVPWQLLPSREAQLRRGQPPAQVDLPATVDDPGGDDTRRDVPRSFDPRQRGFTTRRVRQTWVRLATPFDSSDDNRHDPFALLGW